MARGNLDLAIARMTFLKPAERISLAQSLDRESDLSVLSIAALERLIGKPLQAKNWKPDSLLDLASRDRTEAAKRGIGWVAYGTENYPPLLRELPDPPTVLFYRGVLPDPERPLAAVVGTRQPSAQGSAQAFSFGRDFGLCGVPVVSGLALGIDSMAHRGNLEAHAPTVAVLGSGLDGIYPSSNRDLARRIVEGGGVLLSEYPPGTLPYKQHFPARNRIIAGLSRALVVIEAPEKSGALISADFALDQGRDLWVASACLSSPAAEGCRKLAREGARAASGAPDITGDWGFPQPPAARSAALSAAADKRPFGARAAKSLEFELQFGAAPRTAAPTPRGVR